MSSCEQSHQSTDIKLIQPSWNAPNHVKAFSTTRAGGYSQGVYSGLNLGLHVGDLPETVIKNRTLLPEYQNISWLNQTHSANVIEIDKPSLSVLDADAAFTTASNSACAVMTADCLPILLCDVLGTEVAAIHAGWKGVALGII